MPTPLIVSAPADVTQTIRSFAPELKASTALQNRLPYARAWYAMPNGNGGYLFAPSKWVGYLRMSAQRYLDESRTTMNGRKTEHRLNQWFAPLQAGSNRHTELHGALVDFLAAYGKQPSAACRISLVEDESKPVESDALVDLIIRVARDLDSAQQTKIRSALR